MQLVEVKEVNLWDGGDRHNFGFYIVPSVTDDEIKERYPHSYIMNRKMIIYDNFEELEEDNVKKVREKALEKLTLEEKRALGLI